MVTETNLNFYNLPRQGRSNYFANGYCKIKLFASATSQQASVSTLATFKASPG